MPSFVLQNKKHHDAFTERTGNSAWKSYIREET